MTGVAEIVGKNEHDVWRRILGWNASYPKDSKRAEAVLSRND